MSLAPEVNTTTGRRILGFLAGSLALLLGTWLVLRGDEKSPPEPTPAAPVVELTQAAPLDPYAARRALADFDEDAFRVAAAGLPPEDIEARIQAMHDRPPVPPESAFMAAGEEQQTIFEAATAELTDKLAAQRSALRRACAKGGQASTLYVIATFTPDGKLREHSVTADGSAEVAACVENRLASLTIDPPGIEIMTRGKLEFP